MANMQGRRDNSQRIHTKVLRFMAREGFNQEELGFRMGWTQSYVSRVQNGRIMPTVHNAIRLARVLGATVEELWGEGVAE